MGLGEEEWKGMKEGTEVGRIELGFGNGGERYETKKAVF
jgi:hypothetical protein